MAAWRQRRRRLRLEFAMSDTVKAALYALVPPERRG
jgi:hypothetical protein